MPFKRAIYPEQYRTGEGLSADMSGIGILIDHKPANNPNIEDTLIAASLEGVHGDYRVLSLLVDWLDIHLYNVNAARLIQLALHLKDDRARRFWCAVAQWKSADIRFQRLAVLYKSRIDLLDSGTSFLIHRHGEDERFKGTCLRIPKKTLRHRPEDIAKPEMLVKLHPTYRARILLGPSYRADMLAVLWSRGETISSSELARQAYGSYPTAVKVKREWGLLRPVLGATLTAS